MKHLPAFCVFRVFPVALVVALLVFGSLAVADTFHGGSAKIDFNRDIRPILNENCLKCHGPDGGGRKAKLRFDLREPTLKPAKSGKIAIVPGSPEKSEMIARVTATDDDDRMPPLKTGKKLTPSQIDLLRRWIAQGAPYATHWAYVKPVRSALPKVTNQRWPRNPVDFFILQKLEEARLKPSMRADRYTLVRRVSLDLTGLPPTLEEVDRFVKDRDPAAYDNLVDRLLNKRAFGEHWARLWLDLARYADSAGYADDPPRVIWAYRDWVIRAFNANKPFDRFTIEQIAGDLLDDADEEDRVATAFHRNTMTNNEGGTTDEEFRNAAVVDRVNTTMAVWMATSMGCAQCHNHKYDPISQQDYFRLFAILNNTEDADLKDESPVLDIYSPAQKQERAKLQSEIATIDKQFEATTAESEANQLVWERNFPRDHQWLTLEPATLEAKNGGMNLKAGNQAVRIAPLLKTQFYTIELPLGVQSLAGVRIDALASLEDTPTSEKANGGFEISRVTASIVPLETNHLAGRFVRIELPGKEKILSLAEVQVFQDKDNVALQGEASQSSTAYDAPARFAIDGKTAGDFEAHSTTHTETSENPWWEVDLKKALPIDRIVIWNRTDNNLQSRLSNFRAVVLDENRKPVWEQTVKEPPNPTTLLALDGSKTIQFSAVVSSEPGMGDVSGVIEGGKKKGRWTFEAGDTNWHSLTLMPAKAVAVPPGARLKLTLEQNVKHDHCPPALLRFGVSDNEHISEYASLPEPLLKMLAVGASNRDEPGRASLSKYYRAHFDPALKPERERLEQAKQQLAGIQPNTVPVMRELTGDKRRKTHIQFRGNYLALGDEVTEGLPVAFHPPSQDASPNRLSLARWLVDENNPLTARVIANRFWEQIFGIGIVRTSEDFGSQGDRPSNPELLDWLATEFVAKKWDVKAFLKMLVTSATYCQSSRVTPALLERDPDNLLLARGPRFRASAEIVRDQALAVSGLLSRKMYGPPVRPPQPSSGLTAAFGSTFDWKPSEGEDRFRRALYIEWRRTSPYPSMATFDAPNREVCTLRRPRSNTPLQALVTLNDPVQVDAARALAARMDAATGTVSDKARYGFRLCLARPPHADELRQLTNLFDSARKDYEGKSDQAKQLADTSVVEETQIPELAAWTTVANVLLNLDETLMKP